MRIESRGIPEEYTQNNPENKNNLSENFEEIRNYKESPRLYSKVIKFFSREEDSVLDDGSPEQEQYQLYILERKRDLQRFLESGDKRNASSDEITHALVLVLRSMESNSPLKELNQHVSDQDLQKTIEDNYNLAKDVFIETCKKAYPDVNIDNIAGSGIRVKLAQLNQALGKTLDHLLSPSEINDLIKNDPKKLIEDIDFELDWKANEAYEKSFNDFEKNADLDPINNKKLSNFIKTAYELQLIKDQLYEQVYGNSEVNSKDAEQIDAIREQLNSKQEVSDPHLAKTKEMVSIVKGFLQNALRDNINLSKLNIRDTEIDRWEKLADGLESIRKEVVREKLMDTNKYREYKNRIDALISTI